MKRRAELFNIPGRPFPRRLFRTGFFIDRTAGPKTEGTFLNSSTKRDLTCACDGKRSRLSAETKGPASCTLVTAFHKASAQ